MNEEYSSRHRGARVSSEMQIIEHRIFRLNNILQRKAKEAVTKRAVLLLQIKDEEKKLQALSTLINTRMDRTVAEM